MRAPVGAVSRPGEAGVERLLADRPQAADVMPPQHLRSQASESDPRRVP